MQLYTRWPSILWTLAASAIAGVTVYALQPKPEGQVAPAIAPIIEEIPGIEIDPIATFDDDAAIAPNEPDEAKPVAPSVIAELAFTVKVGTSTYIVLGADPKDLELLPKKGAKIVENDYITSAITPVALDRVPMGLRDWNGKDVVVGNGCKAKVDGFAFVSRLTGDPGYAGIDGEKWTARAVYEHGKNALLARLDKPCEGMFARDAKLAPLPATITVDDPELAMRARADLYGSDLAKAADTKWNDVENWGSEAEHSWRDEADPIVRVVEHGETHERWILVHARIGGGCGERDANVLGVYRVDQQTGKLVRELATEGSEIDNVVDLVDVDNDGRFELVTNGWLGPDLSLRDLTGDVFGEIDVPFFGCPC